MLPGVPQETHNLPLQKASFESHTAPPSVGSSQHRPPMSPQWAQMPALHSVAEAVQEPTAGVGPQHGCPKPPQDPQAPALQIPPPSPTQVAPSRMQTPDTQHPPSVHLFPAQQGTPGEPQVSGRPSVAFVPPLPWLPPRAVALLSVTPPVPEAPPPPTWAVASGLAGGAPASRFALSLPSPPQACSTTIVTVAVRRVPFLESSFLSCITASSLFMERVVHLLERIIDLTRQPFQGVLT